VAETRSHDALKDIAPTSIKINHNTINAPHTDNNLIRCPSIALGLGDYDCGRLQLDGAKAPIHIRDHAVIFDGLKTHSSGQFNGDRWSLVLVVHASWQQVPAASANSFRKLRPPCPPTASDALPATIDFKTQTAGAVADAADVYTSPAGAVSSTDPMLGDVIEEEDEIAKGSAEEAKTKEHHTTHLPNDPSLRSLLESQGATQTEKETCCSTRTLYCTQGSSNEDWGPSNGRPFSQE
jgi:hypothetical protein